MKEMVRLQGITKKFGNNVIIPSLDLTIYDGEFITLLGPSGCGKTTLLRMIAGLETPTEGSIYLDDENVTALPPYKRDVNMVFQHYALFPHMTVEENIKFGLMMKKVPADEQKERVAQVLYLTQLEEFATAVPSKCPADSSSVSQLPALWSTIPRSSYWTSLWARWITSCAKICSWN